MEQRERERILRNWKDECDSAALYEALAAIERNPRLSRVFGKLAASEREHAAYWEDRLRSCGQRVPRFSASLRTRMMTELARRLGIAFVIPRITARELADRERYAGQEDARAAGLPKGEHGHAAVMQRIAAYGNASSEEERGQQSDAGSGLSSQTLGNKLRAAVLGANDGLASNFCLMMGVAGGGVQASTIVLTGVAGLLAGACSMALGEWLSVTNAREMLGSQVDRDIKDLHATAGWRVEELALIFEAKGLTEDDANRAAERIITQDPHAIDALIKEDLVLNVSTLGNDPASAAAYSFALFAVGALVPLLPFFLTSSTHALVLASACLSLLALFALGLLTSFFNGRPPVFSGLRQVGIGAIAAAVTYAAGRIVGAVVS